MGGTILYSGRVRAAEQGPQGSKEVAHKEGGQRVLGLGVLYALLFASAYASTLSRFISVPHLAFSSVSFHPSHRS